MREEWYNLSFSIDGGIGTIVLADETGENLISTKFLRELKNGLKVFHHSKDVKVILIKGNEMWFSQHLGGNPRRRVIGTHFEEVFGMENPRDLVDAVFVDRNSGVAAVADQFDRIAEGVRQRRGDHLRPRNHDFVSLGLFEVQDRMDHLGNLT